MRIYEAGDSGPSGHGQVHRGHVKNLLDKDVDITFRTHQWGWNKAGVPMENAFGDSRFKNTVISSGRINEDYYVESRQGHEQFTTDLTDNLSSNERCDTRKCMIRDFDGQEDIWHTVGGMEWATQAPHDDGTTTVVETDYNLNKVPYQWEGNAKIVDEVWVPNQWVYDAFDEMGYTENVEIVPYGVDFSYKPTDYDCTSCPNGMHTQPYGAGQCLNDDVFNFLGVMRWYHIKGVDILIEAFLREFSGDEDVRLFLKTTSNNKFELGGGNVQQVISNLIDEFGIENPPEIGISTEMMSDQQLMDLYGLADAFSFPSRAECVGIAWVQAMHAGTPVITTDYSAMSEYISDDEALLVDDGEIKEPESRVDWVPRKGGAWYPDGAQWFEADIGAVQDAMREMYEMDPEHRDEMARHGQQMVHNTFDWDQHIKTRVERFKEISQ